MLLPLLLAVSLTQAPLTTVAEQSGWRRTGRYAEVESLCRQFARLHARRVRCERFGTTPEGRPLLALVASEDGTLTPAAAARRRRPTVLFQGGIHAGEIEGKDAGLWLLRELLAGRALPGVLGQVTLVLVPVFNVDGHERFGPNHRPNQVGPEETGWRTNAQNLNLNRDYLKADTLEMAALLRLLHAWQPLVYVDLHATNGAKFEHDVATLVEPLKDGAEPLRALGLRLRDELLAELSAQGHLPLAFYPSLRTQDEPTSGFEDGVPQPRFSQRYWALQQRLGLLVETHSWKPYAHRVLTTRRVLEAVLRFAAREGTALQEAARAAEAEAAQAREVVLAWESTGESRLIEFRGHAYERTPSELSGQPWVRYDETKPEVWRVPLYEQVRPARVAALPAGGYLVPPAHAPWVAQRLALHGLTWQRLARPLPAVQVELFRATRVQPRPGPYEGRQGLTVEGAWEPREQPLPAGTLYVPVAQRGAHVLAHLLEPMGPDSLLAWGFFNAHFEQKEYVEDYVLEPFARELLAREPAVKAAWEARLEDPTFAADPRARLRFFAERHPAWDERLNLYPVLRTHSPPPGLVLGR